jgi:hypothetical protein
MERGGMDWFQQANDMGSVREYCDERVLFRVKRVVNRRNL